MSERRTRNTKDRRRILSFRMGTSDAPRHLLLTLTAFAALAYFFAMAFVFQKGNLWLWLVLMIGEVFHVWLALGYIHTVWRTDVRHPSDPDYAPPVDVFITVAGEPVDVVERTVKAAKAMRYPDFKVHVLNDGLVAKKDNWEEIEAMAKRLKVRVITRTEPGGAKAGNINHALRNTEAPYVVVFDADHVPAPEFLEKTMGYFADPKVAIVQTPQFYGNRDENYVTGGAWEQQELFFGAICQGKNRTNSTFMCGTNMVVRRRALERVGGMAEDNIAEDFLTSLYIHKDGWKSVYVPEVLAEGLAPEDFLSYYKQQFRWARGSLEVIFRHNPLFTRGLTWGQKLEYLSSASYHLSGPIVVMNALLPILFFYTGLTPFRISTMALAAVFLPYIFLMIYTIQRSSNFSYTFRALSFSMGSFAIQTRALWAVLVGEKSTFNVTSKKKLTGNFLHLALPHIVYLLLVVFGLGVAIVREGFAAQVINNLAWALFNASVFVPFIIAASPWGAKRTDFVRGPESEPAVPEYKSIITTARASGTRPDINYITHEHENDL